MTDHEIEALRRENDTLMKALADCREAVFSDSGPESEHFAQAIGCPEAVPAYVKDVVEKLRKSRAEALLDAERAREERNREHVRLNAEWMAKCEAIERGSKILANIMNNNTVAMQAAWIEWQHGEGAESAVEWIENTLLGPGLIPEEYEPHATEAQAYFNANYIDRIDDAALAKKEGS